MHKQLKYLIRLLIPIFEQTDDRSLAFLVDGSASITSSEFSHAKQFIATTVQHTAGLGILSTKILQFSDLARVELKWSAATSPYEIVNQIGHINGIKQNGGNSDIMMGLNVTGKELSPYNYKTVVLLTDGIANRKALVK